VGTKDKHDWLSAGYVDEWVRDWSSRAERPAQLRRVARALPFAEDDRPKVLDVGGGWGPLTEEVLACWPSASVDLLDFSPRMLALADERFISDPRVRCVQRDLSDPRWPAGLDRPYDAVVSSLAVHNLLDPVEICRVYTDIAALVRSGGCFVNLDIVFPPAPRLRAAVGRIVEPVPSRPAVSNGSDPDDRGDVRSVHNQLEWLQLSGFDEVDCLWRSGSQALFMAFK
jgi:tRNA (cmo5U34)-methyltransferase